MSSKSSKKSRRKPDEDTDFKAPDPMKVAPQPEAEVIKINVTPEDGIKTRSRSSTPQNGSKDYKNGTNESEPEIGENTTEIKVPETEIPVVQEEVVIQETPPEVETNGETVVLVVPEEVEMEPLVVEDYEEADPELQFDENSDGESHSAKGSPVLSRCKTRRSQTRNIPTPKTPKSVADQNGEDKDAPIELDVESAGENKEETESELSQQTENTEKESFTVDLNETRESFDSAVSTKVNVGSDLTREIDFSYSESLSERNYGTIRKVSSRRSIRPMEELRKKVMKAQGEKQELQFNESRSSVERLSGIKRKRSEEPDGVKRYKPDQTQGFLSYSISRIKSRFSPRAVEASTPKLTSYRKQDILEDAEISKIENETNPPAPEKKWCLIM